jgi:UDP-N-acetyl-D-mannosaminuronate dehydrogenase
MANTIATSAAIKLSLGGLGFYGMQYAKILGQGSVVIGIDLNEKRVQDIGNAKLVDHALSYPLMLQIF